MDTGFIAQELKEVFPDLVRTMHLEEGDYLGVRYEGLIPYLVRAIQELQEQVKTLQGHLDQLTAASLSH
jgi:hypothetical protein